MRTGVARDAAVGQEADDPKVMLQLSKDGGRTWGSEQWRSAGKIGQYLRRVRWLRQGRYRDATIRIVMSAPIDWQLLALSGDLTEGSS